MFERRKEEAVLHRRPDTPEVGDVQPLGLCDDDQSGGAAGTQASRNFYTHMNSILKKNQAT